MDRFWWNRFENLKIQGTDNQALQTYMDQWDYILEMLPASYLPQEPIMELKFRTNIKKCTSLAAEQLHWFDNFVCQWTPNKSSYSVLRQMCEKHLAKYLKEKTIKRWKPEDDEHHANEFRVRTNSRHRQTQNRDDYRHRRDRTESRGRNRDAIKPRG